RRLALESGAPGVRSSRHLQHAVVGEEAEDVVEVMGIEGLAEGFQRRADVHRTLLPPASTARPGAAPGRYSAGCGSGVTATSSAFFSSGSSRPAAKATTASAAMA